MTNEPRKIEEEVFFECAEAASKSGCLKQRKGRYGNDWAIVLNGHVMMTGIVNEDGDREFYSHM